MRGEWSAARDPLAALQDGRSDLFRDFVASETATFLGFFRRLGAGAEEAEDLTQDLFVRLLRHAPRYRPTERFAAFCFRVARNAWIDAERRSAARPLRAVGGDDEDAPEPAAEAASDAGVDPVHAAELGEWRDRLVAALETLSGSHRMVVELALVQELPYADVARILGIPVGTVKSRMFHALRRLRAELGEDPAAASGGGDGAARATP